MKLVPITDIFDIRYGNQFDLSKMEILIDESEGINFVSRTSENNGSMATVWIYNDIEPLEAWLITVTLGGSYLLASFIQPKPFYTGQNIKVLTPKLPLSDQEKLFYCACIEANRFRYSSHSREANSTFNDITVPAFEEIPESVKNYNLNDKFIEKPISNKKLILDTKNWKWFRYRDIFDICIWKSIDLNKLEQATIGINYVARTEENNGITATVIDDDTYEIYDGGCLTVPMVGNELKASYQTERFCVSQNIAIFRTHSSILNIYTGVFLNTIIRKDAFRFAYGRTLSLERLKMLQIKLPITSIGTPDWQWMEDYIKWLPYSASL